MKRIIVLVIGVFTGLVMSQSSFASQDKIVELIVQDKIGFEEVPVVKVEVEVSKQRELYVAMVNMDGWKTIKRLQNRIKQSGNYHFELPVENLKPGTYRIDAYLAPRRKGWNERLTEPTRTNIQVIDKPRLPKKSLFSKADKIKQVVFPKKVIGKQDVELVVKYDIKAPRDLHIKLLDSGNWKEFGRLKFPLNKSGQINLPLSNMTDDFPASKYAWVVYLSESDKTDPISKKQGKHFELLIK